jgi:hypothetical protein
MSYDRFRATNRGVILVALTVWLGSGITRLDVQGVPECAVSSLFVTGMVCVPLVFAWSWARRFFPGLDGASSTRSQARRRWQDTVVSTEIVALSVLLILLVARMPE